MTSLTDTTVNNTIETTAIVDSITNPVTTLSLTKDTENSAVIQQQTTINTVNNTTTQIITQPVVQYQLVEKAGQGVPGPQGPKGDKGDKGDTGDPGVVAASAPITYDSGTQTVGIDQTGITHGLLTGLSSDDHHQYHTDSRALTWLQGRSTSDLAEGSNLYYTSARFDSALAGKTTADLAEGSNQYFTQARARAALSGTSPVEYDNTTGVISLDQSAIDHGALSGLAGDDHPQYILADGTRAFSGTVAGVTPTTSSHLATKGYVDGLIQGLDWQDSILDRDLTTAPVSPSAGDRYIIAGTGGGWSGGAVGDIAIYSGSVWAFQVPNQGFAAWVEDQDMLYVYNGSAWVVFGSTVDHGNLIGLADDDHTQYHTDARALTWLGTRSTSDLPEGSRLYWTQARFDTAFALKSTTALTEGTNLYYTDERVDDRVAALIQNGTGLTWTYNDSANTLTGNVSLSQFTTGDLTEGSNEYFTQARARAAVSAGNGISYSSSTGVISANFNATNLKITTGALNTVQDINSGAAPTFTGTNFTGIPESGVTNLTSDLAAKMTAVSVASANGFAGSSSGGATPALTLSTSVTGVVKGNGTAISAATAGTDYSAGTSALATGILKSTTSTGALTIAVAGDFPTLNQNTTGSAATLTTARAIYGNNFDGSTALTQIIASTYGGTGNGFTKFSGPATTEKTFTLPNASAAILTDNASVTLAQGGTNANLTASNGGILYSTASAMAILAGTATAGKMLQSGASGAPSWSTPTYPSASASAGKILRSDGTNFVASTATFADTYTASNLLYANGANTVQGLATANNGALVTDGSGVPSISSTLPGAVQGNITSVGTVTSGTWNGTVIDVAHGGSGQSSLQPWFDARQWGTCKLWLDATDPYNNGTQPATGTAISTGGSGWNDKSGNGYVAGQSTSADRPTWGSVASNNLWGVTFDGSNDFLSVPSFAIGSNLTMFVVSISSNNSLFIEHSADVNSHNGFYIYGDGAGAVDFTQGVTNVQFGSTNWLGTSAIVAASAYDGTKAYGYRSNTTTVLTQAGSITNNTVTDTLYIGSRGGSSLFMTGTIFEVIIYSGALPINKIQYILAALKQKWGTV
jgi:hypothetical protein